MMAMHRSFALFLTTIIAGSAFAQTMPPAVGFSDTGQPARYAIQGIDYVVSGYRSATWGMTRDQARAAMRRDFPQAQIAPVQIDPVLKTTILVARLPSLTPGPGPAFVGYVFGAKTGRLMQVNLDWQVDAPTPAQRDALTAAGAAFVADFTGYYWKIGTVTRGAAIGPRTLILFAGSGEAGGAVDVRLEGVPYTLRTPSQRPSPPPPAGPARLHVSFAQTADQPDITSIKSGDF